MNDGLGRLMYPQFSFPPCHSRRMSFDRIVILIRGGVDGVNTDLCCCKRRPGVTYLQLQRSTHM